MDGGPARTLGPNVIAGGTIVPMTAIKLSTSAERTVTTAGAGEIVLGIAQQGQKRPPGLTGSDAAVAAESGDQLDYYGYGDVAPCVSGDTVTMGGLLKSDGSGKLIPLSTTGYACAIALQTTTGADEVFDAFLIPPMFRG